MIDLPPQEADRRAHGRRADAHQHRGPGRVEDEDGRLPEVQGEGARGRGGQSGATPRHHRRHAEALPAHEVSLAKPDVTLYYSLTIMDKIQYN